MANQVVQNYSFNAGAKTITLPDFTTNGLVLNRLALIVDTTLGKILYNFADPTVSATIGGAGNKVITLSTVSGASSSDALMIVYNIQTNDPSYDTTIVTANAGTNLNTSALALETGGHLSSIDSKITTVNTGAVTISSALPAGTNTIGHIIIDSLPAITGTVTANAGTNLNTSALALETGGNLATIATNTTGLNSTVGTAGSAIPSKVLMMAGSDGTNARAIKTDNTGVVTVSGTVTANPNSSGSTGSSVPASASYHGVRGTTALPTAVSDGQLVGAMGDKFGRQVVYPLAMRDLIGSQRTTISNSSSETTIVTAAANTYNDIFLLTMRNTSSSAVRVDIRDTTSGTIIDDIYLLAGQMLGWAPPVALPQTSTNTNWTAQCSTGVTDVRITAWFVKNK